MATKIYGASDDLIEFEGDISGETGGGGEKPTLIVCSDGTVLEITYGKGPLGVWAIVPIALGHLFGGVDICRDEDADPYSDIARFRDGLKWAYAATEWERVS